MRERAAAEDRATAPGAMQKIASDLRSPGPTSSPASASRRRSSVCVVPPGAPPLVQARRQCCRCHRCCSPPPSAPPPPWAPLLPALRVSRLLPTPIVPPQPPITRPTRCTPGPPSGAPELLGAQPWQMLRVESPIASKAAAPLNRSALPALRRARAPWLVLAHGVGTHVAVSVQDFGRPAHMAAMLCADSRRSSCPDAWGAALRRATGALSDENWSSKLCAGYLSVWAPSARSCASSRATPPQPPHARGGGIDTLSPRFGATAWGQG